MNSIYLRRKRKIFVEPETGEISASHIAAMQRNIESLGFAFSESLIERLKTLSLASLVTTYQELVKTLKEMVGAHREFKPFYPNFPDQVMAMSEARLYLNAWLHYITDRLPKFNKEERFPFSEPSLLKIIDLGSKEDFEAIFIQMARSKTSLSLQDKADLAWFIKSYGDDIHRLLPAEIHSRENLALIGAQLLSHTTLATTYLTGKIKTATDILRIAVALGDGDVSLAKPTKFPSISRAKRKWLLSWLEQLPNPTEDMLRWAEYWKRLGERLHPGEYKTIFPKTHRAFEIIRNDEEFSTFNSNLERKLVERHTEEVLALLKSRPGDLARRLDHLLRISNEHNQITEAFGKAAVKVSTPVLLQIMTHFKHRSAPAAIRAFFPKGEVAKVYATTQVLMELPTAITNPIVTICEQTLISRFSKLPSLGSCYLDPVMADYLVPFSQRSAGKALRTLVRGSRLPLPEADTLRFFLWWKNGSGRTDIDLSAVLYDANFNYVADLSYYNLKNFGGHHSGDIVDAPNGAAEFIDIRRSLAMENNVRYVVMAINSYTAQPYCDLPECFAGWMSRREPGSGEIFEARSVQDKVDIASDTRICIPAIFDLEARQVIWADIALKKHPSWNNVRNNLSGISVMLRAMCLLKKTDLHSLFSLHIQARGTKVGERSQATTVFSLTEGITPFDLTRIASEFL